MTKARIYSQSKNTMQSGLGKAGQWVLEYVPQTARNPEQLMGWVSSGDTLNQVKLRFDSQEDAVAYAEKHALDYHVLAAHQRKVKPRNYGDNFRYFAEES